MGVKLAMELRCCKTSRLSRVCRKWRREASSRMVCRKRALGHNTEVAVQGVSIMILPEGSN
ncbi:hypothetical protein KFK09_020393 [Dendrobium nobile]|uniref:F-box protein n=1 Tax=Dendrobium nobile TaxID=94219 RepID=A0A8T3AMG9_DENNO|nr:hypothetical protein KFK09_020393 [Dendrobium nobile]